MKPSSCCDSVVDVTELVKFTLINRGVSGYLTCCYSERKEAASTLEERVGLKSI